jgi:hypothetical protein
LIPLAEELLEAPKELILTALELERSEGAVIADKVGDTACTFLAGLYRAEQAIAERLIRVVSGITAALPCAIRGIVGPQNGGPNTASLGPSRALATWLAPPISVVE